MSMRYCPICETNYNSAMGPHSCAGWHPARFLPAVPTPCPDCAEKDARIAELERAVTEAHERAERAIAVSLGSDRHRNDALSEIARLKAAKAAGDKQREEDLLGQLRLSGWRVAVHNDYCLSGKWMTFWLFVKDGRAIKGEGATDEEAIRAAFAAQEKPYGK